jgi:hypothetical protein
MKVAKPIIYIFLLIAAVTIVIGILLLSGSFHDLLINTVSMLLKRDPKASWAEKLHLMGWYFTVSGIVLCAVGIWVLPNINILQRYFKTMIKWSDGFLHRILRKSIVFNVSPATPQPGKKIRRVKAVDLIFTSIFLLTAIFLFLARIQGSYPRVQLGGDSAHYSSFAARADHPELFQKDELMSEAGNLGIYATINIPITSLLAQWLGNYGLAFAFQIIPLIFLQLVGFYIFGQLLFKNRFWALVLTLALAAPIDLNAVGENWGLSLEPVSRYMFQSLLPFMLALVLLWRRRPSLWPFIMAVAGLLAFVHPVSIPAWGAALWLGFLVLLPASWSSRKRAGHMAFLAGVFLLAVLPYTLKYFNNHIQGHSASYDLIYHIITTEMSPYLLDIPAALGAVLAKLLQSGLLPAAILGLFVLSVFRKYLSTPIRLFLAWMLGIFLVSVLLTWAEHLVERYLNMVPLETEMVRGIRYFVPILVIFTVWAMAELSARWKPRAAAHATLAVGILLLGTWSFNYHLPSGYINGAVACLKSGHLVCPIQSDENDLIQEITRITPPGSSIFTSFSNTNKMAWSMDIRYLANRSLAYTWKDRGILTFTNAQAMEQWSYINDAINAIESGEFSNLERFSMYLDLAERQHADYLVIDFNPGAQVEDLYKVVYKNNSFILISLNT